MQDSLFAAHVERVRCPSVSCTGNLPRQDSKLVLHVTSTNFVVCLALGNAVNLNYWLTVGSFVHRHDSRILLQDLEMPR